MEIRFKKKLKLIRDRQAVKYNSPIKKVSNTCYNGIAKTQKTGGRKPMESLAQKTICSAIQFVKTWI